MTRPVKRLLEEAYEVQDACNLIAVIGSFHRAMKELRENGITNTDDLNKHPVCVLYCDKIMHLTDHSYARLNHAYDLARTAKGID